MSAAAFIPSARSLGRGLRFCAAALVVHGILLWLSAALQSFFPGVFDRVGEVLFWVLAVPALLLASPFTALFWKMGLMSAPGWFAWPKPLGIALAYAVWVALFLILAQVAQRWTKRN